MPVELRTVSSRTDLKEFVQFQFNLYKTSKYWVPPLIKPELRMLRKDINPALEHCDVKYLVACHDGKIVGRIAGIINHEYNRLWQKKVARFCWFDFIDDTEVSGALLRAIEEWAASKGMVNLTGPMGFTTFEKQGVLIEGFDMLPTISSTYNFDYYQKHLEVHGYTKSSDYLEFLMIPPAEVPEKVQRVADFIRTRYKVTPLRTNSKKKLMSYSEQALEVINKAYAPIVGFVPLTHRQITYTLKKFDSLILPDFTTIVTDIHDRVVGFQIAMPSLSEAFQKANGRLFPFGFIPVLRAIWRPKRLDMLLVGVIPEYQNKGVNALFMTEIIRSCSKHGIRIAESNGLLEENTRIQEYMSYFESRQHKRRRLYKKEL